MPIDRSIPIAIGRVQTPSGRWMRVGIRGSGVTCAAFEVTAPAASMANSKRSTDKFGDYFHVFSSFIIFLRDLPGKVPENFPELIFIELTLSCASEPFAHGFPCGKRVRWSSFRRP